MFTNQFLIDLDTLLARHGLSRSMSRGGITITDLLAKSDTGKTMLRAYGSHYGLTEEDHGTIFVVGGQRYKLIGLKTSRPKYPLECEHMGNGKPFKFSTSVVPQIVAQRGQQTAAATPPAPSVPVMQLPQGFIPPAQGFTPPPGFPQF